MLLFCLSSHCLQVRRICHAAAHITKHAAPWSALGSRVLWPRSQRLRLCCHCAGRIVETFSCPEKGVLKVSSVTAVDGREQACVQVCTAGWNAGALHVGALFRSAWLADCLCCGVARLRYLRLIGWLCVNGTAHLSFQRGGADACLCRRCTGSAENGRAPRRPRSCW